MRAEVGLVSSNIVISSLDGPSTYSRGTGELFGAQVLIIGNSSARISHVAVSYGGQAGLNRAAVTFQGLKPVSGLLPLDALPNGGGGLVGLPMPPSPPPARSPPPSSTTPTIPNPSFIAYSSVVYSMDAAVSVSGSMTSHPTTILGALSPLTSHYNADLSDLWRGLFGQGDLSDVLRQPPSSCSQGISSTSPTMHTQSTCGPQATLSRATWLSVQSRKWPMLAGRTLWCAKPENMHGCHTNLNSLEDLCILCQCKVIW